jgi:hypothetical protein
MAKKKSAQSSDSWQTTIVSYRHGEHTRLNIPEVGLVTPDSDPDAPQTTWLYDPHIDPALQFDSARAAIETLIDDALASGDAMRFYQHDSGWTNRLIAGDSLLVVNSLLQKESMAGQVQMNRLQQDSSWNIR